MPPHCPSVKISPFFHPKNACLSLFPFLIDSQKLFSPQTKITLNLLHFIAPIFGTFFIIFNLFQQKVISGRLKAWLTGPRRWPHPPSKPRPSIPTVTITPWMKTTVPSSPMIMIAYFWIFDIMPDIFYQFFVLWASLEIVWHSSLFGNPFVFTVIF